MKKLYVMAHSEPPDFDIILLEQITLYSSSPKTVQQVVKNHDDTMLFQAQAVNAVTSSHGVIDRITALLYSFAYVSSDIADWCGLDQSRSACQEIWRKMQNSEKYNAPMSFYNDAYLASAQLW